jgi:hypothetical protein
MLDQNSKNYRATLHASKHETNYSTQNSKIYRTLQASKHERNYSTQNDDRSKQQELQDITGLKS